MIDRLTTTRVTTMLKNTVCGLLLGATMASQANAAEN
jgi:hypothetical protein